MMKLSLCQQIDPTSLSIYHAVSDIAQATGAPYVVVGAAARDLVLHYCYNAPIQRATVDIDIAIQVSD